MSLGSRRFRGIQVSGQRGITLILFTAGTLAIVAMAGLALDLGMAYLTKTRLQNALDAAALSGAKKLILSGSATQAQTAALATFNLNNVNMNGAPAPTVETSSTPQTFPSGGAQRFLKVTVPALPVTAFFSRVLPDMSDSFNVGGTAIAGPKPLGLVCGALPMGLCGTPGDSDCSDGACFGISPTNAITKELELPVGNTTPSSPPVGPGNYGLLALGCTGAACVRDGMAGGGKLCYTPGDTVKTEPGNIQTPTAQGVNTRFDVYNGPVSDADYPSDVVVANTTPYPVPTLDYAAYMAMVGLPAWDRPNGREQRRVAPVVVLDCSSGPINGTTSVPAIGSACLFFTRKVDGSGPGAGTIYGQLVGTCLTMGGDSDTPPPEAGPAEIVLFQNPGGA